MEQGYVVRAYLLDPNRVRLSVKLAGYVWGRDRLVYVGTGAGRVTWDGAEVATAAELVGRIGAAGPHPGVVLHPLDRLGGASLDAEFTS